jgi:hypothetical protein
VPDPSLRSAAIADLRGAPALLQRLIATGEDLFVERKVGPNDDWLNIAEAVASFANSLGGWLLLGVHDDGRVTGWSPPGRSDGQSHIGQKLRERLDPLPSFTAAEVEHADAILTVIRVYPSEDTPVVVSRTGGLLVRTAAGKQPVTDHRSVLALAQRGQIAEAAARQRLRGTELMQHGLLSPDPDLGFSSWSVAALATPVTRSPVFRDWALTSGSTTAWELAEAHMEELGGPSERNYKWIDGDGFVHGVRRQQLAGAMFLASAHSVRVALDANGLVGIRTDLGADGTAFLEPADLTKIIRSTLMRCESLLFSGDAPGATLVEVTIDQGTCDVVKVARGVRPLVTPLSVTRRVTLPGDERALEAVTGDIVRQVIRSAGRETWDD